MPGGHRIRDLRGGCRGALSDNRPHSARRGRRDGEGGFWMAAPERRPRGHGGADGNVLADNRAVRPKASGIRFPEITVRYRPARPNGSHAVGYDRIALGRSDPGRAKAATLRTSCFMPCSVEAGANGKRGRVKSDRGFTVQVITDHDRPAPVMSVEPRAGRGCEGAKAFPIRVRGNARFSGPAEPMACAYGCTGDASTGNLKILSVSTISAPC